jgi:GT2 family glycosyltransferase
MEPEPPLFSIIVPTYSRPQQLAECLESLACLDYPRERFEVVVVDDGSGSPPADLAATYRDRLDVTLLTHRHAGPGAARNRGAAHARGRFLAFTDDDCTPDRDWLRKLEAAFARAPDRMIGGRTVNRLTTNSYATTSQVIVDAVYAFYNQDPAAACFFASNNLAIPAGLFREVGGFDEAFRIASEDRELCDRWLYLGYRMTYVPEAVVFHAHPLTLGGFCRQHFNYGRGACQYQQLRSRRGSGTFTRDMQFHTRLPRLLRQPLAQLPWGRATRVALLLVVWQIVNALGFFCARTGKWQRGRPPT